MKRAVLTAAFMLAAAPAFAGWPRRWRVRRSPHGRSVRRRLHHEQPGGDDGPRGRAGVARPTLATTTARSSRAFRWWRRSSGDRNLGIREIGGEAPSCGARRRVRRPAGDAGAAARARPAGADAVARPHHRSRRRQARRRSAYNSTPTTIAVTAGDAKLAVQRHITTPRAAAR